MKLFRTLVLLAALGAFAAVNAVAAGACINGTLQSLINQGNCSYTDKIFSDWVNYNQAGNLSGFTANGTPTDPTASQINVAFTNGGLDSNGVASSVTVTFTMNGANTVAYGQTLNLQTTYVAQVNLPGGDSAIITSVSGTSTGAYNTNLNDQTHPLTGTKELCEDAAFDSIAPVLGTCNNGTQLDLVYSKGSFVGAPSSFSPSSVGGTFAQANLADQAMTTVGLFDQFTENGGKNTASGSAVTAEIVSWSNTIFETDTTPPPSGAPEPSTLALIGSALVGLGFIARRKKSA